MSFTEAELAYAAGLLDGEGCVTIVRRCGRANSEGKRKNRYHELIVELANTDRRMIDWLYERWGGTISYDTGRSGNVHAKPIWHWILTAGRAALFLKDVAPFLVIKADRAKIGLIFRSTFTGRGCNALPDGVRDEREAMRDQIMALNKRGVV